jgi:hypothetical protein
MDKDRANHGSHGLHGLGPNLNSDLGHPWLSNLVAADRQRWAIRGSSLRPSQHQIRNPKPPILLTSSASAISAKFSSTRYPRHPTTSFICGHPRHLRPQSLASLATSAVHFFAPSRASSRPFPVPSATICWLSRGVNRTVSIVSSRADRSATGKTVAGRSHWPRGNFLAA